MEYLKNYYTKKCFLFFNYCNLIFFLQNVYLENKNKYVMFLSRDSYFIFLLYKEMYPDLVESKDYSYIYSSRDCFSERNNDNYKKYIESFTKKNILFVDIYGSGTSFLNFINFFEIKNIELLFFSHDHERTSYLEHFNKKSVKNFFCDINGILYESIFRAPHLKVVGITNNFKPIFSYKNSNDYLDNINDKHKNLLVNLYHQILVNMPYNKNIRYLTLGIKNFINLNQLNQIFDGMVVFDIDNTITNVKDYKYVREIVNKCNNFNIKIIFVTARQVPYQYGEMNNQKFSNIMDIIEEIDFDYESNILDVWFNPFCFISNNVKEVKYLTIQKNMTIFNIEREKLLFFDDCLENVKYCGNNGIQSRLVKVGEGIDEGCLELFNLIFEDNTSI